MIEEGEFLGPLVAAPTLRSVQREPNLCQIAHQLAPLVLGQFALGLLNSAGDADFTAAQRLFR